MPRLRGAPGTRVWVGGAMCRALSSLFCQKSGNWSLPASSDGSSPVNHIASVGLDRATHSYVCVGFFRRVRAKLNPILLAKCRHDDFPARADRSRCSKLSSFGSLQWFRREYSRRSRERCPTVKSPSPRPGGKRDSLLCPPTAIVSTFPKG